MSKGQEKLEQSLMARADEAAGATLTRDGRESTMRSFASHLHSAGYNITDASQLKAKHVESYAQARSQEVSARTLKNELGDVRKVLSAEGKDKLAESDRLSNKQLVGTTDRTPARTAPDQQTRDQYKANAAAYDRGVAAAMGLMDKLGLRDREAIQSPGSLKTWERQLEKGKPVEVVHGTKGGRPREVSPVDRQGALQAVREARQVAAQQNGKLIQSPTLRGAASRLSDVAHKAGARGAHSPHSFRYAFAQRQLEGYRAAGYTEREARAKAACDLGHGDGRGRYVASVYGG